MKVMWLSNKLLSEQDSGSSGTWLDALAPALIRSGEVQLGNIALGPVAEVVRQDFGSLQQWAVPFAAQSRCKKGLPPDRFVTEIVKAVEDYAPDLIHVWGPESFWGLLTARRIISRPALLETQGIKGAIARVFSGGLSFREQLACIGPKEIIKRSTVFQERKRFAEWGMIEKEIIAGHRFITTQSAWTRAQITAVNDACTVFQNELMLREPFYASRPWRHSGNAIILCSAAYPSPFKGVHVAIRALALLKKRIPDVQLRIVGAHQISGPRRDGYVTWLNREVRRLGVETHVHWLGSLPAAGIISELQRCSVFVMPSFIESNSAALAEAMLLGVPAAASFVGGVSSAGRDDESLLFFPAGDDEMCAYQLERLLVDRPLAERLSGQARKVAQARSDAARIVRCQVNIYRQILAEMGSDR